MGNDSVRLLISFYKKRRVQSMTTAENLNFQDLKVHKYTMLLSLLGWKDWSSYDNAAGLELLKR
jgi:hypothetical protein